MTKFNVDTTISILSKAMETHHRFAIAAEDQIPELGREVENSKELDLSPLFIPFEDVFSGDLARAVYEQGGFPIARSGSKLDFDDFSIISIVRGSYSSPASDQKYPPMPLFIGGSSAILKTGGGVSVPVYTRTTLFTDSRGAGHNNSVQFRFQLNAMAQLIANESVIVDVGDPIDVKAWFNVFQSVSNIMTLPWAGLGGWGIVIGLDAAPWLADSGFAFKLQNDASDSGRLADLSQNIVTGAKGVAPLMMDALSCIVYLVPPTSEFVRDSFERIEGCAKPANHLLIPSADRVLEVDSIALKQRDTIKKSVGVNIKMRKPAPQSK